MSILRAAEIYDLTVESITPTLRVIALILVIASAVKYVWF